VYSPRRAKQRKTITACVALAGLTGRLDTEPRAAATLVALAGPCPGLICCDPFGAIRQSDFERGLLRMFMTGRRTTSALAALPLTPSLSPGYRGEGVIFRP
jgi:hypothetical protein